MADYDRYGNSSRSDVYVPMPVDRAKVGEKKIEKLQEEIERLENDQRKRKELIEKLTRMQEVEDRRSKQQDVISERFTRRRDLLLNEEMERVYGQNSPRVSGKSPAQMMDNLLAQRNREFSMKQKEKELETKYLVQERERLQQARERVREQRRNLLSPAGKVDTLELLKELGLYHNVDISQIISTTPKRKKKRRVRYVAYPISCLHWFN